MFPNFLRLLCTTLVTLILFSSHIIAASSCRNKVANTATTTAAPAATSSVIPDFPNLITNGTTNQTSIAKDIYRHRAQSGVNLGAWFLSEQWMMPNFYSCATWGENGKRSEQNIAEGCDKATIENHMNTWITKSDFTALAAQGINTVRLPVGYWTLGRAHCACEEMPYWPYIDKYEKAWRVVMQAIEWAGEVGIGVLLDYHGAHGSQNGLDHSGSNSAQSLLSTQSNQDNSISVLRYMADQVKDKANIVGIELLNEPFGYSTSQLGPFYLRAAKAIQEVAGADFPIYIFGNTDDWSTWVKAQTGFFVMDTHQYYVFGGPAATMTTDQLVVSINNGGRNQLSSWGPNLIVGEFSCAVDPTGSQGWSGFAGEIEFCDAQMKMYSEVAVGWHYWSLRLEGTSYTEWDWKSVTKPRPNSGDTRALVVPPNWAKDFNPSSSAPKIQGRSVSEHMRRSRDWKAGYETAKRFAQCGSRLGFVEQYLKTQVAKRSAEGTVDLELFKSGLAAYTP